MYAVVKIGSYQYKVSEGDTIEVNRLEGEKEQSLTLDKVLLFSDGKDIRIGQPYLDDVKVTAKLIDDVLGAKTVAFKFRRRKSSAKKIGNREKLTALNITKIAF
ncbi:MAG: 50S ribosomal protein L21 [Candidatus Omnitrophica bacterium]|nr:50S ribosomal protein L21 [Candidatus Omnitrophota bacterium]